MEVTPDFFNLSENEKTYYIEKSQEVICNGNLPSKMTGFYYYAMVKLGLLAKKYDCVFMFKKQK